MKEGSDSQLPVWCLRVPEDYPTPIITGTEYSFLQAASVMTEVAGVMIRRSRLAGPRWSAGRRVDQDARPNTL